MRFAYPLLLAVSLAAPATRPGTGTAAGIPAFNARLEGVAGLTNPRRAQLIGRMYRTDLAGIDLRTLGDTDLEAFFLASLTAAGLAQDLGIATHARAAFQEMQSRGVLVEADYRRMQGLYVGLRAFDDARRFHDANAGRVMLEALPAIATVPGFDPTSRTVLAPTDDGGLRRQNLDIGPGTFVLVVADPLCHFTQDAIAAIRSDPRLGSYFPQHSKWLVPSGMGLDLAAVQAWNGAYPDYPLTLVDDVRTWTDIDYWGTPTFYLFEQGQVVRVIRGWPAAGHADELTQALGLDGR